MNFCVENISFKYNGRPTLQDISFTLGAGEILGVIGVNGVGKSTLLKCLNKILHPQRGVVFLDEKSIFKLSRMEIARHIGYVPQQHAGDQLTVYDTVLLGRKPYIKWAATQKDYAIVEQILSLMDLESFAMRPVDKLSGGELQKVIIARALAQEPDVLLLDEPTSNLDMKNQIEVMRLIRQYVQSRDLRVIVSIHDLNQALRFADRFLMLKDGRVHTICDKNEVTSEMIQDVFGVSVMFSRINGYPVVIPVQDNQ
ncbi:MAG: ABC transporter ATP-binding protein [Deltaproteobacteria bacterium]|nr:ABC transporter ATP-binding protein [Deltaproteobacteria bacterium]